ncbi:PREDICTED: putative inositol monophosphatase 3 [Cyphomyrmex costatus]|uniref:inositol-phosphate phosphatase n=1 Tax=Cyphomyrmex costatus TaxID=456900 RepID=A0A195CVV4_9HYME|nr:PREDICTED: putative inositol monophosphatase 3 [Cyphomyrmex costatus]XP_018393927.1 PREDICTED: putative inositol monophosphatase 3 [Cyphomyrmex costatus]XP_018393928.1 PREDICTED: putative inositol monophosphatase 3 [Cyphomyrmex costatus]XP_018393929.1 PREDICTED: putative inositol monophosphatase 3 [Cyphomyrmex costatus]XP_018393930.1 PREDICTED: putative inositol monophosphatase 3 [Cyphomyrmex costatus]KYN04289.1 Putative inositol monophosphatase 3 [Cyphomyrmex costatus]
MSVRTQKILLCALIFLGIIYFCMNRHRDDKDVSLKQLLAAAIRTAEIGGLQVVAVHDQIKFKIESKGQTKEGINDPVTAADYRSHCAMYRSLTEAFPGITVISEETSQDCDKIVVEDIKNSFKSIDGYDISDDIVNVNDITIWIDPLDATKEFTENLLQYVSTMVCIAVKGQPIIGVIYKPFETKQNYSLFWTWSNHGVSRNLKNLPKVKDNKTPILIVSLSHAGQVKNTSKIAFGDNAKIISAAGAGYKFLEVAVGNATAYVHTTAIKKWDICAGTAILSALGGTVTQLYDQQPIYFGTNDAKVLTKGLLATMSDHAWYSEKFLHDFPSDSH